ncbi:MAG: GNAT family N-acetyltransferase [Burkholderiales bacterium]|nr:GNAT family N-acetyltransferase [Burkholderiales bacterium]
MHPFLLPDSRKPAVPTFTYITLPTKRLLLRPLHATDAPGVMALFTDAAFMRFGTTPPFAAMDEADALIARDMQAMASGERIRLGIERLADHALIGICTLFNLDAQCRSAEIGYGLLSDAWGQGYMHEAVVALLDYGFGELKLNRVEADIDPRNTRSAKSLERAGFTKEGLLRESCIVNGVLTDSARYGLLQREWTAHQMLSAGKNQPN